MDSGIKITKLRPRGIPIHDRLFHMPLKRLKNNDVCGKCGKERRFHFESFGCQFQEEEKPQ